MAIRRFIKLLKTKITSLNSKHLLFYNALIPNGTVPSGQNVGRKGIPYLNQSPIGTKYRSLLLIASHQERNFQKCPKQNGLLKHISEQISNCHLYSRNYAVLL